MDRENPGLGLSVVWAWSVNICIAKNSTRKCKAGLFVFVPPSAIHEGMFPGQRQELLAARLEWVIGGFHGNQHNGQAR